MMSTEELQRAAHEADMIVDGYAFKHIHPNEISILHLHHPYHALLMTNDAEILETSMDDIELTIVLGYWARNKKYMEELYA